MWSTYGSFAAKGTDGAENLDLVHSRSAHTPIVGKSMAKKNQQSIKKTLEILSRKSSSSIHLDSTTRNGDYFLEYILKGVSGNMFFWCIESCEIPAPSKCSDSGTHTTETCMAMWFKGGHALK